MIWQIKCSSYRSNIMDELLQDGWEPFAITVNGEIDIVWFRKLQEK